MIRGFNTISKINNPKVNIIARLEFELTYSEATVLHFSYFALKIPSRCRVVTLCRFFRYKFLETWQYDRNVETEMILFDSDGHFSRHKVIIKVDILESLLQTIKESE